MNKIWRFKKSLAILTLIFGLVLFTPISVTTFAQSADDVCRGVTAAGGSCTQSGAGTTVNEVIAVVVNILSTIVGIVAVIMLIIGGFKYVTSSGDSNNVQSAKNTILFAIVGLVIVAAARIIVGFVLEQVT